ncbi:MAG: restriction endonuclease subunit S, partial [Thauera sp.]|nr:restriction endonuclease subunit S [Thauera sp.]
MAFEHPTVRLGDFVDACLGKMLDAHKNRGVLQPYLGNSNVRWGAFDLEDLAEMRFEEHEDERYSIRYGDLIVCEGGEPGRCAIWRGDMPGMKIQKALHRVRVKEGLDNYFLYYWFLQAGKTGALEPFFTGSTIKHLTSKALSELQIPLPPIGAQRRLATVLKSLDDKIDLNRRINQTLEAMAQAIFKSWFVDFDPVKAKIAALQEGRDPLRAAMSAISGKVEAELDTLLPEQYEQVATTAALFPEKTEESELGEIPTGWSVACIRDVVEGVYDGPHATPPEATAGAVFLGIRNMTGTSLDMSDIRHIAEADWAQWTRRV